MSRREDRRDLQTLIDVLQSVARRRRIQPGACHVHLHPDELRRLRQLTDRIYGQGGRTLDDVVGLPVRSDRDLSPGEIELWP